MTKDFPEINEYTLYYMPSGDILIAKIIGINEYFDHEYRRSFYYYTLKVLYNNYFFTVTVPDRVIKIIQLSDTKLIEWTIAELLNE